MTVCKYIKKIGSSCSLNNSCKYPNCNDLKVNRPKKIAPKKLKISTSF